MVEAKPPAELVEAIQGSADGSTAPPEAQVLAGTDAPRPLAARLVHEEPQKPSDLPDDLKDVAMHGASHDRAPSPGRHHPMSADGKHLQFLASQQQQQAAANYNRQHPGAGKAGRGDQAISGAEGISRDAKGQQGGHNYRNN